MKSYTDIEQSKKLAEILPIESADMHYERAYFEGKQSDWFIALGRPIKSDDIIPCWSLAALLNVLPKIYYPVKDHPTYLILGEPKDTNSLYNSEYFLQDGYLSGTQVSSFIEKVNTISALSSGIISDNIFDCSISV